MGVMGELGELGANGPNKPDGANGTDEPDKPNEPNTPWVLDFSLFVLHVSPPWRGRGRLLHLFPVLSLHRSGSAPAYGGAERLCQPCGKRRDDDILFILKNAVRRKALRHCSGLQAFGFQLIQDYKSRLLCSADCKSAGTIIREIGDYSPRETLCERTTQGRMLMVTPIQDSTGSS